MLVGGSVVVCCRCLLLLVGLVVVDVCFVGWSVFSMLVLLLFRGVVVRDLSLFDVVLVCRCVVLLLVVVVFCGLCFVVVLRGSLLFFVGCCGGCALLVVDVCCGLSFVPALCHELRLIVVGVVGCGSLLYIVVIVV